MSSQSFSREKGSFFSHNVKSVLPFARWPRRPVSVPEQTLLTRSQTGEMWKCLLAAGDSWLPFNLNEFSNMGEDAAAAAAGRQEFEKSRNANIENQIIGFTDFAPSCLEYIVEKVRKT